MNPMVSCLFQKAVAAVCTSTGAIRIPKFFANHSRAACVNRHNKLFAFADEKTRSLDESERCKNQLSLVCREQSDLS